MHVAFHIALLYYVIITLHKPHVNLKQNNSRICTSILVMHNILVEPQSTQHIVHYRILFKKKTHKLHNFPNLQL